LKRLKSLRVGRDDRDEAIDNGQLTIDNEKTKTKAKDVDSFGQTGSSDPTKRLKAGIPPLSVGITKHEHRVCMFVINLSSISIN